MFTESDVISIARSHPPDVDLDTNEPFLVPLCSGKGFAKVSSLRGIIRRKLGLGRPITAAWGAASRADMFCLEFRT
jgi:hypothetical protein